MFSFSNGQGFPSLKSLFTLSFMNPKKEVQKAPELSEQLQPEELIAHLAHKEKFEEGTKDKDLTMTALTDSYFDSLTDTCHFRIGHDDWMPIPAFMAMVESTNWLKRRINETLWLEEKSDTVIHWFKVNHRIIQKLECENSELDYHRDYDVEEVNLMKPDQISPKLATKLSLLNVANLYLAVHGKAQPVHKSNYFRMVGHPILGKMNRSVALSQYHIAEEDAKEFVDSCVKEFFKEHGFEISHDGRMVNVPGYEPLYFVDVQVA